MLDVSVHVFSFENLLFDHFKVLGHFDIFELFSFRRSKTSFIRGFSRCLLVDTAMLYPGNLSTKRYERFVLFDT